MPNTRAHRTGMLCLTATLALGLTASCGKESGGGGSGGSGTNVDRTGGTTGSRGGAGGASSGAGGSTGGTSGGTQTGGSGISPVTGGASGSGAGGSGAGADAGPAANYNPPADKAVAKFCNGLIGENMMILEFALDIGMPAVRLVAKSGECFPAVGQPCASIPVGPVNVSIVDLEDQSVLVNIPGMIPGGSQVVFFTDIDQMSGNPYLGRQTLPAAQNCAGIGLMPAPPADGGAPPAPPRPPLGMP